jgi:hypothetical protein
MIGIIINIKQREPHKKRGELRCLGRIKSSCFTSSTRYVNNKRIKLIFWYQRYVCNMSHSGFHISLFVWWCWTPLSTIISWPWILLVEKTGGPGENHRHVARHRQTLSHIVVHLALIEIWTHNISGNMHWLHR